VARGRISSFPIDLRRRPYNTLALPVPCECVIYLCFQCICTVLHFYDDEDDDTGENDGPICRTWKNRTMLDAKFVQPAVDPELLCIEQWRNGCRMPFN